MDNTVLNKRRAEKLIDLNEVVRIALRNLRSQIKNSEAIIFFDELPVVKGHKQEMIALFYNLFYNALRIENPLIHVRQEKNGRKWLIQFKDNGTELQSIQKIALQYKRKIDVEFHPGEGRIVSFNVL